MVVILTIGSQSEMESLERQFVAGEWTPCFVCVNTPLSPCNTTITEEPPTKKCKKGKENQDCAKARRKPKQQGIVYTYLYIHVYYIL